ncbi:GNAT family N-acetyltransferase [Actinopolymorpha rutila]|uniref:GNAT superfamily N-acetyltransferase n=1 Tax=Actinopolymorpha rutila TaxID=446787 RepID=A0A852ZBG6_9ACTN|nr:GNAT superfamily N-acetyltransferase [Actinopolymorpha rutila]
MDGVGSVNSSVGGEFEFDDDPGRVDLDALWEVLSTQVYWGKWRSRDHVRRQVASAWRVVGVYESASGRMVGFARAVSDGVALAYLADVYVLPGLRGKGLGTRLVEAMVEDGPGADFRWMLHTANAHGLYGKFGFAPPDPSYLERPRREGPGTGTP